MKYQEEIKRKIEIPKWCLGKCEEQEFRCCRCGTERDITYQAGDGKRLHSLCYRCYNLLKKDLEKSQGVSQ